MKDCFNIDALNKMTGGCGCVYINKAVTKQRIYKLIVESNVAELSKLTGTKGTDLLIKYNLTKVKLKCGAVITGTSKENLRDITPSTGSFMGYIE